MKTFEIRVSGKGLRKASVEKLLREFRKKLGKEIEAGEVRDVTPGESRADRLAAALQLVEDGRCEVESLKWELQQWRDGLPENLQSGTKADELEGAIGELDELEDMLNGAAGVEVNFPAMY